MRFGLSLPVQHPVDDDLGQRFAELLEMVRLAIELLGERVLPHFR